MSVSSYSQYSVPKQDTMKIVYLELGKLDGDKLLLLSECCGDRWEGCSMIMLG